MCPRPHSVVAEQWRMQATLWSATGVNTELRIWMGEMLRYCKTGWQEGV